jgi:TRAP-type C4-dicarboxylate transport system permease small subunit
MAAVRKILDIYSVVVRGLVMALAVLGALAVLAMMGITCTDVVMRMFGSALGGARDMVCVAGAVAAGCALPYTTAVKGHVSVEYFFHKLGRVGRIAVDTVMRLAGMSLFSMFSWCCIKHARMLGRAEVYDNLPVPKAGVSYLLAFCCGVVVLVILHNLLHPCREMIKP